MYSLNLINLVQAGTISVSIMGALLLWRTMEYRGIALLLVLIAIASCVNILEESGVTREFYLISPMFLVLVGPATYLAAVKLTKGTLHPRQWLHLLPGIIALGFTAHVQWVIGVGTGLRVIYAVLTGIILIEFKKRLDEARSDSDEFSLSWLVGLVVVMTLINLIDLARLNTQPYIPPAVNHFGQGFNNFAWLVGVIFIVLKLSSLGSLPKESIADTKEKKKETDPDNESYRAIFEQLDSTIKAEAWYRTPRLTLSDLSEHSGLVTRDISRAINLVGGQSFNDYINSLRIADVCNAFITTPDRSMIEVALDAGFSSKASFNQTFKKFKGQTPSQYKSGLNA